MARAGWICVALLALAAGQAAAEPRTTLGFGRLFSNDIIGDGRDRWRSGSYSYSIVRGPDWQGRPPAAFGALLEYRLRNEILAPSDPAAVGAEDRPYAGILSAGLHTHVSRGAYDLRLGADIVFVGPQTGVGAAQDWFHERVSAPDLAVLDTQLPDAVHLQGSAELSRSVRLSPYSHLRGFVELQAGPEDLIRAGADVAIGPFLHDDLLIRDSSTGHLYRGISGPGTGFAFVAGADVARVRDSAWLPASRGVVAEEVRYRVRGGVHWQLSQSVNFFYGLTYLSEEFEGQPEGQVVGSLKLNFNF